MVWNEESLKSGIVILSPSLKNLVENYQKNECALFEWFLVDEIAAYLLNSVSDIDNCAAISIVITIG